MLRSCCRALLSVCLILAALPAAAEAFAEGAALRYRVQTQLTYASASGQDLELDLYQLRGGAGASPLLVYFHGGGWVSGNKESAVLQLLPYLEMGWTVVNVEYRLARVAPAPAAVEDARCALRWIQAQAPAWGLANAPLVVAGDSAGGHLALMAAMLPTGSPFDRACPTPDAQRWGGAEEAPLRVAAVINWYGISDVAALLAGPDARHYAMEWFGSRADRAALARELSPLHWVRAGSPPVISVHGDADPVVPYRQAQQLHAALAAQGVRQELVSVAGGKHGLFSLADARQAQARIRQFLRAAGVVWMDAD